ncbi:NUDIX domain-containing protein [Oscillospiraceae bacterium OttesenSCG-928-F05]|nr:NUDIX domain-containing protein [Oscillospiraceae bacterium OttesenSCG-928-F05]
MIRTTDSEGRLEIRVSGLLRRGGDVLVHHEIGSDYYSLPDGLAYLHEDSETAIFRIILEKLGSLTDTVRLLWIVEQFFTYEEIRRHEIGFFYLLSYDELEFAQRGRRFTTTDDGRDYEFRWVRPSKLREMMFFPTFLQEHIMKIPIVPERMTFFQ